MHKVPGSVTSEKNGIKTEEMFFTYSDKERREVEKNKNIADAFFSPQFIKWSPHLADIGLTDRANILYGFITFFAFGINRIDLSDEEYGRILRCSPRHAYRFLKELKEAGLIKVTTRTIASGGRLRKVSILDEMPNLADPGNSKSVSSSILKEKKIYGQKKEHKKEDLNKICLKFPLI